MKNKVLLVEKSNLFNTKIETHRVGLLKEGQVLLQVGSFALTANNITYAVTGEYLRYWDFFPTTESGWGIIPCWGFAEVVASEKEGVAVGEWVYGYFPMAEYLKVEADKVKPKSFMDVAAHRQPMSGIYNRYTRLGQGIPYPSPMRDYVPIMQPLFATSFLNYQFLKSSDFFGAADILLTSASSKTALGIAFMLRQNQTADQKRIIGLTSKKNVDFVKRTGFYDVVFSYDDVPARLEKHPTIVVDLAGNASLLSRIYQYLSKDLTFISKIGLADWSAASLEEQIPVAKFFFAPTAAEVFFKEKGAEMAMAMIWEEMSLFIKEVDEWMDIEKVNSFESLQEKYSQTLKGEAPSNVGYIVKMN